MIYLKSIFKVKRRKRPLEDLPGKFEAQQVVDELNGMTEEQKNDAGVDSGLWAGLIMFFVACLPIIWLLFTAMLYLGSTERASKADIKEELTEDEKRTEEGSAAVKGFCQCCCYFSAVVFGFFFVFMLMVETEDQLGTAMWALFLWGGLIALSLIPRFWSMRHDEEFLTIDGEVAAIVEWNTRSCVSKDDAIILISTFFSIFQLSGLSFSDIVPWPEYSSGGGGSATKFNNVFSWVNIDFPAEWKSFSVIFWVSVGIVNLFIICIYPFCFILYRAMSRSCEHLTTRFLIYKSVQEKAVIQQLFLIMTDMFFLPFLQVLLKSLDCTYGTNNIAYLDAQSDVQCWVGIHSVMACVGLWTLASYLPIVLWVSPFMIADSDGMLKPPKSVIRFVPAYLVIERLIKFVFSGVVIFMSSSRFIWATPALLVIMNVLYLYINFFMRPCTIESVNRWRIFGFLCSLWASVCSMIAIGTNNRSDWLSVYVLLGGWGVAFFAVLIWYLATCSRSKKEAKIMMESMKTKKEGEKSENHVHVHVDAKEEEKGVIQPNNDNVVPV